MEYLKHRNVKIPFIGIGTWTIGDNPDKEIVEINTIKYEIFSHDMCLIDTAEMYGLGKSELIVGKAIANIARDKIFIIGKILPCNAMQNKYEESCRESLKRLGIDYFDIYLLHWRDTVDLKQMVTEMEKLKSQGLIKEWGVSNFDTKDMEDLFMVPNAQNCFMNQCLYNLTARGPEFDLIPWCKKNNILFMAYSPFGSTKENRQILENNTGLQIICKNKNIESLSLQFIIRNRDIITAFKTSSINHVNDNMKYSFERLTDFEVETIDKYFPSPTMKIELKKI